MRTTTALATLGDGGLFIQNGRKDSPPPGTWKGIGVMGMCVFDSSWGKNIDQPQSAQPQPSWRRMPEVEKMRSARPRDERPAVPHRQLCKEKSTSSLKGRERNLMVNTQKNSSKGSAPARKCTDITDGTGGLRSLPLSHRPKLLLPPSSFPKRAGYPIIVIKSSVK